MDRCERKLSRSLLRLSLFLARRRLGRDPGKGRVGDKKHDLRVSGQRKQFTQSTLDENHPVTAPLHYAHARAHVHSLSNIHLSHPPLRLRTVGHGGPATCFKQKARKAADKTAVRALATWTDASVNSHVACYVYPIPSHIRSSHHEHQNCPRGLWPRHRQDDLGRVVPNVSKGLLQGFSL